MSDTENKQVKDFNIEITVKINEKNRAQYSSDVEVFRAKREQTLMVDSTATLSEIKKEVLTNVRDVEKTVNRFFEQRVK